jgi:hypothetical protein
VKEQKIQLEMERDALQSFFESLTELQVAQEIEKQGQSCYF